MEAASGSKQTQNGGITTPPISFVNLKQQHDNFGYDKSSDARHRDSNGDAPSDTSYNSFTGHVNDSYNNSYSDSTRTSDSEFERNHTLSSSTEHSRKSIR